MLHVFTSAAVNYLPKVRILCESVKKYHPELYIHVVLADKKPDWLDVAKEPFDNIITIDDLNIEHKERWIFFHDIVELSTAIKPFALQYIFEIPACEGVFFLDPDIVIFNPLTDLFSLLRKNSIILTPHQTKPEESIEAIMDNEICSLQHGMFNLGFIGVAADNIGKAFADWWAERLYYFCRADLARGLFTDQKWANFIPIYFDNVHILKSSQYNVAPWNLSTRNVTGDFQNGFMVDGLPLVFYHFTGFDSGAHKTMANKYANDNQTIAALIAWYEKLNQIGKNNNVVNLQWAYGHFANGDPITKEQRNIYRLREDLQNYFSNPFAVDNNSFFSWFNAEEKNQQKLILQIKDNKPSFCNKLYLALKFGFENPKHFFSLFKRSIRMIYDGDWKRISTYLKNILRDNAIK